MFKARKYVLWLGIVWLAVYLGCGNSSPKAAARPAQTDSVATDAICETIPRPASVAAEPTLAPAKPASEPAEKQPAPAAKTPATQPVGESEKSVAAAPKQLPRLWDFGSDNCIPCRMMMPILDALAKEYAGRVDVRIINVYKEQALAMQYRIQIIPTQVFIDPNGKELYRHVGFFPRDSILAKFNQFGFSK
ncbi:MAG: thioredoxin domain-containing protein [candidate division WOR-3 bacterium]